MRASARPVDSENIMTDDGFTLTRVFDAPVDLVWRCWTEQEHLARWSAPRGCTIPDGAGDVRPGGRWRCLMVDAQGGEHRLGGVYREIVPHQLIVMTHAWDEAAERGMRRSSRPVRGLGRRTRVTLEQSGFDSSNRATDIAAAGTSASISWPSTSRRYRHEAQVDQAMTTETSGSRSPSAAFDAPRERVGAHGPTRKPSRNGGDRRTRRSASSSSIAPGRDLPLHDGVPARPRMYGRFIYRESWRPSAWSSSFPFPMRQAASRARRSRNSKTSGRSKCSTW